jgi:hypothetical protein
MFTFKERIRRRERYSDIERLDVMEIEIEREVGEE